MTQLIHGLTRDEAVGRLEDGFQVIINQLKEVIDGETDISPA